MVHKALEFVQKGPGKSWKSPGISHPVTVATLYNAPVIVFSLNIVEHTLISVVLSIGYLQIKFEPRNAGVYSAQIQVFPSPVVPEVQTGTKLTEPSVPCLVSMEIVAEEPKVEVRTCLHR